MKIKVILTAVVLIAYELIQGLINLFYSPIAGQIAAQQVNDSNTDYALAKFVREGHFQGILVVLVILALTLIWAFWNPKQKTN